MTATQNSPHSQGTPPPGPPGGNKKTDAIIAILAAIIGGGFAGILRRTMEGVSYYEAISTAGVAALLLGGFIFVVLTYIRS